MGFYLLSIYHKFAKYINFFSPKEDNSYLFIPHRNCINDHYDIINYTADNALVLCRSLMSDNEFFGHIYLVYYDIRKKDDYIALINQFGKKVELVNGNEAWSVLKAFFRCKTVFTCHPHYNFCYRVKRQRVICLGYFSPFKNDYFAIKQMSASEIKLTREVIEESFSWHITTSDVCGRILASDTMLSFSKMIPLGFPRNDVFYKDNSNIRKGILEALRIEAKHIICYTPTYRDYERVDLPLGDSEKIIRKTVWGNFDIAGDNPLMEILEKNNAIIIVKLHPWQEKSVLMSDLGKSRIYHFSQLQERMIVSLYDVLAISDCLITDYTSTAFDFLHTKKPMIFYMYDYEKYIQNRGFSYNPINTVCGGPIAYDFKQLLKELDFFFSKKDLYSEKRDFVHALINKYMDGNSTKRVKAFIKE